MSAKRVCTSASVARLAVWQGLSLRFSAPVSGFMKDRLVYLPYNSNKVDVKIVFVRHRSRFTWTQNIIIFQFSPCFLILVFSLLESLAVEECV